MATTSPATDPSTPATRAAGGLLVSLPPLPPEIFAATLTHLGEAFHGDDLLVATPEVQAQAATSATPQVVSYTPTVSPSSGWVLTAADFVNARDLLAHYGASSILLLCGEPQSIGPTALSALAAAVAAGADAALPRYDLPPRTGLVNAAILYPVTRALFGAGMRYPLPLDVCLSARAVSRLAAVADRSLALNQPDALVWMLPELASAGFNLTEVPAGTRALPAPPTTDLNALLAQVGSSFFAEIDSRAALWQRTRPAAPLSPAESTVEAPADPAELEGMIDSFRLAFGNLQEIWSLVLPPQSLVGLKRLSQQPATGFRMAESLWARIVYDFILAFRLRTLNRGHLLGAMTPLYLAWVASHLVASAEPPGGEAHIEAQARAFEADKPYLVSRWRWPDRFNP